MGDHFFFVDAFEVLFVGAEEPGLSSGSFWSCGLIFSCCLLVTKRDGGEKGPSLFLP